MHELPMARSALELAVRFAEMNHARRIAAVNMEIGAMRDFVEDTLQRYWDFITRGTIAEKSRISITFVPITCRCKACGTEFGLDRWSVMQYACPQCGASDAKLLTGNEFKITSIAVEMDETETAEDAVERGHHGGTI